MYGALDRSVGAIGIRIAVGLAGACVAVFLFRVALHATNDRVRALALGIPALACSFSVCSERPLMFGLALLGVLVFTVEVPDVVRRAPSAGRDPDRDVALGERARHVLARLRCTSSCTSSGRWLDGAPPGQGRERDLLVGGAIAARS